MEDEFVFFEDFGVLGKEKFEGGLRGDENVLVDVHVCGELGPDRANCVVFGAFLDLRLCNVILKDFFDVIKVLNGTVLGNFEEVLAHASG